jgi:hypothetical protein
VIDTAPMQDMLNKFERSMHRVGWDKPPLFATVWVQNGKLMAEVVNVQFPDPVVVFLAYLADSMDGGETHMAASFLADSGTAHNIEFLGFIFAHEVWIADGHQVHQAQVLGGYHKTPGVIDARQVVLVDAYGRVLTVFRRRDENPTTMASDGIMLGGSVTASIAKMVRSVARHMPDHLRNLAALDQRIAEAADHDDDGTLAAFMR